MTLGFVVAPLQQPNRRRAGRLSRSWSATSDRAAVKRQAGGSLGGGVRLLAAAIEIFRFGWHIGCPTGPARRPPAWIPPLHLVSAPPEPPRSAPQSSQSGCPSRRRLTVNRRTRIFSIVAGVLAGTLIVACFDEATAPSTPALAVAGTRPPTITRCTQPY